MSRVRISSPALPSLVRGGKDRTISAPSLTFLHTMNFRILFILAAAILSMTGISSAIQAEEPGPIVKSIEVQIAGPKSVSKEKVQEKLQTQVGKAYSSQVAEADIRLLSAEENVVNVRIFGEPVKGGVKVI